MTGISGSPSRVIWEHELRTLPLTKTAFDDSKSSSMTENLERLCEPAALAPEA